MDIIQLLQSDPTLFAFIAIPFGLIFGSFLNVVIYRLPIMMESEWKGQCKVILEIDDTDDASEKFNLATPRSCCPQCNHQITALENIPIVSYLFLGGQCSQCKTKISLRYPLIELVGGAIGFMSAYHFGFSVAGFAAMALGWALLCLTMIDYDHQLLPDSITLPFLWIGLLLSLGDVFLSSREAIIGAAAGYLSLWTVYILFKTFTGKEGMGFGDFKLLACLGAWCGWQLLPLILVLSSAVGATMGIAMMVFGNHERGKPIPFGPFLAIAGWLALFWGNDISQLYLDSFMR